VIRAPGTLLLLAHGNGRTSLATMDVRRSYTGARENSLHGRIRLIRCRIAREGLKGLKKPPLGVESWNDWDFNKLREKYRAAGG